MRGTFIGLSFVATFGTGCGSAPDDSLLTTRGGTVKQGGVGGPAADAGEGSTSGGGASSTDAGDASDRAADADLPPSLPIGGPVTVECSVCAWDSCKERTKACLGDEACAAYFQCFSSCVSPCWDCLFDESPTKAEEVLSCTDSACPGICPTLQD